MSSAVIFLQFIFVPLTRRMAPLNFFSLIKQSLLSNSVVSKKNGEVVPDALLYHLTGIHAHTSSFKTTEQAELSGEP